VNYRTDEYIFPQEVVHPESPQRRKSSLKQIHARGRWLLRKGTGAAVLSPRRAIRIEQGIEIGKRARELFPGAVLLNKKQPKIAAGKTRELLTDLPIKINLWSQFLHNDYTTKRMSWSEVSLVGSHRSEVETVKTRDSKKRSPGSDRWYGHIQHGSIGKMSCCFECPVMLPFRIRSSWEWLWETLREFWLYKRVMPVPGNW